MNFAISDDFPAMITQTFRVIEDENSRVKSLLIATTGFYILSCIIGFTFGRFINSEEYVAWYFENSYSLWVSGTALFFMYAWTPLAIFLFIQGVKLKKRYSRENFTGDRSVGNLSFLLPLGFLAVYVATRLLY